METVSELKNKLIALGKTNEELKGLSKGDLRNMLEGNSILELEEEDTGLDTDNTPGYGEDGWDDYIMSLFKEDELYNEKHPKLNGLRRVALKVFGQYISSMPVKLERSWDGTGSAYCVYEIRYPNFIVQAAGDASPHNMDDVYNVYPVPMAENRAEARAYRKALLIKEVTAEEIKENKESFTSVLTSTGEYNENDTMSSQQEVIIKTKCRQINIDYDKFILENSNGTPTRKDAVELINKLNIIHQGM